VGGRPAWDVDLVPMPADSERAVEIPWAASAIATCFGLWLDVGCAYAERRYWEAIPFTGWRRYLRYGYGFDITEPGQEDPLPVHVVDDLIEYDFQKLPRFDLITCISTLEHIGCDNTRYHPNTNRRDQPFELQKQALQQLLSALTCRGKLLLTLPYGVFQDHGWFLQYNAQMVQALSEVGMLAGKQLIAERYYQLQHEGWQRMKPDGADTLIYRAEEGRASAVALLEFGA